MAEGSVPGQQDHARLAEHPAGAVRHRRGLLGPGLVVDQHDLQLAADPLAAEGVETPQGQGGAIAEGDQRADDAGPTRRGQRKREGELGPGGLQREPRALGGEEAAIDRLVGFDLAPAQQGRLADVAGEGLGVVAPCVRASGQPEPQRMQSVCGEGVQHVVRSGGQHCAPDRERGVGDSAMTDGGRIEGGPAGHPAGRAGSVLIRREARPGQHVGALEAGGDRARGGMQQVAVTGEEDESGPQSGVADRVSALRRGGDNRPRMRLKRPDFRGFPSHAGQTQQQDRGRIAASKAQPFAPQSVQQSRRQPGRGDAPGVEGQMLERQGRGQGAACLVVQVARAIDLAIGGEGAGQDVASGQGVHGAGHTHNHPVGAPAEQPRQVHLEAVAGVAQALGGEILTGLIGRDGGDEPVVGQDLQAQPSPGRLRRPGPAPQHIGTSELDLALHCHRFGLGLLGGKLGGGRMLEQAAVMDHRAAGQGPVRAHGPHVQEADLPVVERLWNRDGKRRAPLYRRARRGPAKAALALGQGLDVAARIRVGRDPADQRAADDARHPAFDHRVQRRLARSSRSLRGDLDFNLNRHL